MQPASPTIPEIVAVKNLVVFTCVRNSDHITIPSDWGEIANDNHVVGGIRRIADIADNTVIPVIWVDPAETSPMMVVFPQTGFRQV